LLGISFLPILGVKSKERAIMKSCVSTIGLGIAVFAFFGFQPAEAGCQLIHATHSATSQAKAVETSQALALRSAYDLQRSSGWSHITLSAHPVQGEPFWKAVRPNGVPAHARLQPDLVTAQFYTTCFTGVVVRYVCTTGSSVCGQ
jgi:hypothetical protein